MILKKIKFTRFKGLANEWSIEGKPQHHKYGQWLSLANINLIVGKNASGKTKTIDAIRHIADLFSGDVSLTHLNLIGYGTGEYHLEFDDDGSTIKYFISFETGEITEETLEVDGESKLHRSKEQLWYEEIQRFLAFQTDRSVLAISKRDKKQHPFFEQLYSWGKNLNHFRFGTQLGKNSLLRDLNAVKADDDVDLKDGDEVTEIFIRGQQQFQSFVNAVMDDMKTISYRIETISADLLKNIPISAYGLRVKEFDLRDVTDQTEMSQGMFRALSLIIQLNYSLLTQKPSCILIDDIGEGLDYERSKKLIGLIIDKVASSNVQVIMTTNDRFVMNEVPLDYWSVIQREPNKSLFYNYENAKATFDDFQFTGLSNFDFLTSEFYIKNSEE